MIANDQYETAWSFKSGLIISMQTRRNFGERVLSIFLTKIMATIFDFNGSGRLGRERSLYQGVVDSQKYVERWGRRVKITPVKGHLQNSVRQQRNPWLVQLSSSCQ